VCVCVCLYCEDKLLGRKNLVRNSGIGTTMSSYFVHKNLVGIAERSSLIHGSGFFFFIIQIRQDCLVFGRGLFFIYLVLIK
jgi:hypothetical protein